MTNEDILKIAMEQSAIDMNCQPEDFDKTENVIVESKANPKARKYLELPFACSLVSYGTNIVASVDLKYKEAVENYTNSDKIYHCFGTPNLYALNEALKEYDLKACFMAQYFLPDADRLTALECGYEIRFLEQKDFEPLYLPQWGNALCEKRKELDVLGAGAYKDGRLVGLAGCSADCDDMWQIGVDVLPEERRQGIAAALTSHLAAEILNRGKVPFYSCAWANVKSSKNAVRSGFYPAWVEMNMKTGESMNRFT